MRKYTQKQLREFVRLGIARDITHISTKEAYQLYTSQEGKTLILKGMKPSEYDRKLIAAEA